MGDGQVRKVTLPTLRHRRDHLATCFEPYKVTSAMFGLCLPACTLQLQ
jgi:hypothetical protein